MFSSNLNEWIKDGVPFCTGEIAEQLLNKYREDEIENEAKESKPPSLTPFDERTRVQLRRLEDQQFHSRAMSILREWLDAPSEPTPEDPEGTSLLLPSCNSFLRRALYESISSEYGTLLVLETVRDTNQIKVWRLTTAERKGRNARLRREGFERILKEKLGTWRVFLALHLACSGRSVQTHAERMALAMNVEDALAEWEPPKSPKSSRQIPLIVHNGLQDLLFLMTHFNSEILPETWPECKEMIHSYFPVIYDTKLMANECCHRDTVRGRTHLGALYELALLTYPRWNRVFTTNGSAEGQGQLHDAGFDAYW
jgi:poly(A)-specific ribonuclease